MKWPNLLTRLGDYNFSLIGMPIKKNSTIYDYLLKFILHTGLFRNPPKGLNVCGGNAYFTKDLKIHTDTYLDII